MRKRKKWKNLKSQIIEEKTKKISRRKLITDNDNNTNNNNKENKGKEEERHRTINERKNNKTKCQNAKQLHENQQKQDKETRK